MEYKLTEMSIECISREDLSQINGGGATWAFLGKVVGTVKNFVEDICDSTVEGANSGARKCPI